MGRATEQEQEPLIITRNEDGVTIAARGTAITPGEPGVESVVVAGGSIDVAVTDPALPFSVRLHSPDIAGSWLALVVGDGAARAALEEGAGVVEVETTRGPLADVARRFALGTWLHRWWVPPRWSRPEPGPRSPQEWLLAAELGYLAHAASALFGSFGVARLFLAISDPVVEDGLDRRLDRLAHSLPVSSLVPAALADDRIASVIAGAAAASLDIGLGDDGVLDSVAAAESRYWDVREGVEELVTSEEFARDVERLIESWSVRLPDREYWSTIDPVEVHPRSVRATLVSWEIRGASVRVEIESPVAGSIPLEPGELYARVEVGDRTYAIPLDASPTGYVGERTIDAVFDVAKSSVRVSVYSDRVSAGARRGRSEEEILRTREWLEDFSRRRAERAAAPADFGDPAAPFAIELEYLEDPLGA